jgi:hypothetical protein
MPKAMTEGSFTDGYLDGWGTVAGSTRPPGLPTCPPAEQWAGKSEFQLGFEYGRADALEQFQPDS